MKPIIEVQRFGDHDFDIPEQAHIGDAGFDLRSTIDIVLKSQEQKIIPVGFGFHIPINFVGIVKDRSSFASKKQLYVSAGVIDSTYRGQVHVVLRNGGINDANIAIGDRIAQLVVIPCFIGKCKEVSKLSDSSRSDRGFGSTGVK